MGLSQLQSALRQVLSWQDAENDKVIVAFIDSACHLKSNGELSEVLWDKGGVENRRAFTDRKNNHCDYVLKAFFAALPENITKADYEIMLLNILNADGECSAESLIDAIQYAEKNGASICNLSLSTYIDHQELRNVIKNSKMLFVVAAGNDGENLDKGFPSYPSKYSFENVISVAASDENGEFLEMSNYGEETIDVVMNGIIETEDGKAEGTSIAAARATAAAMERCLENNHLQNIHELL